MNEGRVPDAFSPDRSRRPIEVLHVEDDEGFAELTALRLDRTAEDELPAIEVRTRTDPRAAIDVVDEVDCVVSDYDMPGIDGLEFLKIVRERDSSLPFVLFTGKGSEEIASRAISAGVTDYLRKGGGADRFDVLANRIRNACARVRAEAAAAETATRLRRVLDRLPQCVFVKDREGRYRFINEAGAAGYGRPPEEIEGELESAVIDDPETVAAFRSEDETVLETGEPLVIPDQQVDEDRGERIERVVKYPLELGPAGERMVLGIAVDVTDERRLRDCLDVIGDLVDEVEAVLDEDPDAARETLDAIRANATVPPSDGERVPAPADVTDGGVDGDPDASGP